MTYTVVLLNVEMGCSLSCEHPAKSAHNNDHSQIKVFDTFVIQMKHMYQLLLDRNYKKSLLTRDIRACENC